VRIFTGGPLPEGADSVVIQEDCAVEEAGEGEARVLVKAAAQPGRYIRRAGLDFAAGDRGVAAGRLLTARDIGLAAAMNVPWLKVRRRPRIALLNTGDEVVMPGEPIRDNQIVGSNGPALGALVRVCGGEPQHLGIALDSLESLEQLLSGARGADLLVTTGGASVGEHDLVQRALERQGLELDFWKIAMRPGKPLMFGSLGETPVLGLPGNPVSAIVCAALFLRPAMEVMLGRPADGRPAESALLTAGLAANDHRQDYLRARLGRDSEGRPTAEPFAAQDSSMLATLASADCLIVRPPHAPALAAGASVPVIPLQGGI